MQRGKSVCFEYGIFKRELKQGRLSNELAPTIRAYMGDNIQVVMIAKCFQQNTRDEVRFLNGDGQVAGALASEVGAKQQNYIHQRKADMTVEVRRLIPDEADQAQGFPKGYTNPNGQADALRYRVDGNSWATPCARRVIKGVHKADEKAKGTRRKFKYGTISSGIEAHTVASRGLGDECVFLSEIDPGPISILKHYYPQVPILGDMTLVDYDPEKKVIHNRPYDGYEEPDEKSLGFKPYKTETPVEISAEHGEVALVSGGTPCFTAGNMVLTDKGYRPIEEIKVGDVVVSHLGNLCKVVKVGKKKANTIYSVKCHGRPQFNVTDNHPFFTGVSYRSFARKASDYLKQQVKDIGWRSVSELNHDTFLSLLDFSKINKIEHPSLPKVYKANELDVYELIGWYLGDGYIRRWKGKSKKALILCLSEQKFNVFKEHFDGKINYTPCNNPTAIKVQICCTALANFLSDNFGELSFSKTIPAWAMTLDDEQKKAIVRGYQLTDGHFNQQGHGTWRYSTVSLSLAYGMADLIGDSQVSVCRRKEKCEIEGRIVNQRDSVVVSRSNKPKIFHHLDQWAFVRIDNVIPAHDDIVYNLEVEGDHTYICNGFCVHNCQSFSVAGKRAGGAEGSGTRSALAFQLPRIGKALGSDWIMWENVPGALSSNGGRDILWFFYRCMEAGYTLAWRTFDAQYVRTDTHPRAVPQRRRRIFMVGYKGDDWRVAAEAVHEPISVLGTEPPERVVGKGFTTPNPNFGNVQQRSALEDFQLFMTHADKDIVRICKALGVCEDPETTLKKLKGEIKSKGKKKSAETAQLDMFAMLGCEEKPQGVDLHEKDLDLRFPNEGDIRKLGAASLYDWARTVSSGIGYCGPLFANKVGAELEASVDNLAEKALNNIGNAGIMSNGIICTMSVPEWNAGVTIEELEELKEVAPELFALYDGTVCGLSDILELVTDPKYQLSWRACYGIIRRAKGRGKLLPIELGYALVARIIEQAPFVKWIVLHGKRGTTGENGELKPGEADIAEAAYQEVIESANHFVDCVEQDPKACGIPETDESDDDGDISTEFIEGDEDGAGEDE